MRGCSRKSLVAYRVVSNTCSLCRRKTHDHSVSRLMAKVQWAGQSLVEVLVITAVLISVFWGYGKSDDGALLQLWRAMQGALTEFASLLALPV